jgi:hypothetical protein
MNPITFYNMLHGMEGETKTHCLNYFIIHSIRPRKPIRILQGKATASLFYGGPLAAHAEKEDRNSGPRQYIPYR